MTGKFILLKPVEWHTIDIKQGFVAAKLHNLSLQLIAIPAQVFEQPVALVFIVGGDDFHTHASSLVQCPGTIAKISASVILSKSSVERPNPVLSTQRCFGRSAFRALRCFAKNSAEPVFFLRRWSLDFVAIAAVG
jgi:hypothetical protein